MKWQVWQILSVKRVFYWEGLLKQKASGGGGGGGGS
jgi:hypothetical protein